MKPFRRVRTAEYWEGYQAFTTRQPCKYTLEQPDQRRDWAAGYCTAVDVDADSKVWYKSRGVMVGLGLLVIGVGIGVYGVWGGGGQMVASYGGGVSSASVITTALRLIAGTNVTLFSGGGHYTPPPNMLGNP